MLIFLVSLGVTIRYYEFPGIGGSKYVTPPVFQPDLAVDDWLFPAFPQPTQRALLPCVSPIIETFSADHSSPTMTPTAPENLNLTNSSDLVSPTIAAVPTPSVSPTAIITSAVPSHGLPELLGRGHRSRKSSVLLKDYVVNASRISTYPSLAPPTSNQGSSDAVPGKTLYPISAFLSDATFSTSHSAFLAAITSVHEPKSYNEAILDDVWNDSMTDQMSALDINKTWVITTLLPGKKAIGSKWVYRIKHHSTEKLLVINLALLHLEIDKRKALTTQIHLLMLLNQQPFVFY